MLCSTHTLAGIQPEQRAALYKKLPPTSEPSLLQWARSYRVELDLSSDAGAPVSAAAGTRQQHAGRAHQLRNPQAVR